MFGFGSAKSIDFLPPEPTREWLAEGLAELIPRLGEPARTPRLVLDAPVARDFDDLFTLVCAAQAEVGQREVEFTLVEMSADTSPTSAGYQPLGNPAGQLMHTFVRDDEYVLLTVPAIFRVPEILRASVARELGRIGLHRAGGHRVDDPNDREGETELAAIALGLGVWVANGAYVYENACCGGGCGIDLRSLRAGLSLSEACYALALDAQRRGLHRRAIARRLEPTQRAAFKDAWPRAEAPQLTALGPAPSVKAL